MAKTIKTRNPNGELFPLSLIAVSENLYCCIAEAIEKQIGARIRKITYKMMEKTLNAPEFEDIVFVSKKGKTICLPVTVTDISFPASQEYGKVKACLLFPLRGEYQKVERLMEEIIKKTGLENVCCAQNGIGVEITLADKDLPCQISPNPLSSRNGNGQKVFVTKKEILSGCSPIR